MVLRAALALALCTACPAGQTTNTTGNTAETACNRPCRMGHYCDGSQGERECPAGAFAPEAGASRCRLCSYGTIAAEAGATECAECRKLQISNSAGTRCMAPYDIYNVSTGRYSQNASTWRQCTTASTGNGSPRRGDIFLGAKRVNGYRFRAT